ncbi:tetratricopeptide repeat protein [Kordiimonas sp.]|uniref:tetratricopeptide repeat protein n=1 Tax=Kordiimonas sp. TaxID=1970157 RepID=UPI003A8EF596
MLIIGYHVAKTGGTTVMHHIQTHLGPDAYFGYGQHPASDRFFSGKPLWEELTAEERAPVRFVFGHHVNDYILAGLSGEKPALFTVLRDPYTHFVSQYKYHLTVIRGQGQHIGARDYFAKWQENRVSGELCKFFSGLYPDADAPVSEEKITHILRQFRFLCATEKLTEHSAPISRLLDIPPVEGRHRVSKNQADLEGLSPEEVYERCPLDHKMHAALLEGAGPEGKDGPLAYDDALFQASLDRLSGTHTKAAQVRMAYERLAHFFRHNDLIEAAQLHLALSKRSDPSYTPIVKSTPLPKHQSMKLAVARSEKAKADVYARHRYPLLARACFEKAITLNENYIDAYVGLANVLARQGHVAKARDAAQHALSLDGNNHGALRFLRQHGA